MARRGRGKQNIQYEEPVQEPNKLSHLQPELLTEDVLRDILRERGVTSSTINQMNRDELAGLFYKHVTPKPQRDLRENRRGKLLMKVRKKRERIIKDDGSFSGIVGGFKGNERISATSVGNQNNVTSRVPLITSGLVNSAIPSTAERLKPPPSCIDPARKTIKLGGGSSTPSLNIVDRKTVNLSSSSTSSSSGNMPEKKVIKLSGTSLTPSLDRLAVSGSQRPPSRPGVIYAQHSSRDDPVYAQQSTRPDYVYGHHCDRDRAASSEERYTSSQAYSCGERLNNQDSEVRQRNKSEIRSKLKLDRSDRNYRELSESKERKGERKRKHSRESSESDVSSDEEARTKKWENLQKSHKKKKHKKHSESEKEKHSLKELEKRKKKKSKKKRKLSEDGHRNPEVVVIESRSECERKKKKSKKKKKKREHSH